MKALFVLSAFITGTTVVPFAIRGDRSWKDFRAAVHADYYHKIKTEKNISPNPKYPYPNGQTVPNSHEIWPTPPRPETETETETETKPSTHVPIYKNITYNQNPSAVVPIHVIPERRSDEGMIYEGDGRWSGPVVGLGSWFKIQKINRPQKSQQISSSQPNKQENPHMDSAEALATAAYAAQKNKSYTRARDLFEKAIAQDPRPQWIADSRRLHQWFHATAGLRYRTAVPAITTAQRSLGQGGSWNDLTIRLNGDPDHPLEVAGFLYGAQEPGRAAIGGQSLQAGIGLRWHPFDGAQVEIGHFFKVGQDARNDWIARAGFGKGLWQPHNTDQTWWWHWQARGDIAVVGLERRDIFAQADGRIGIGLPLSPALSLTPYAGLTATLQNSTSTETYVDFGPGLWFHFNGAIPFDTRLEYRFKLGGNSPAANGLVLTAALSF